MLRVRRAWAGCILASVLGSAGGALAVGQGALAVGQGAETMAPGSEDALHAMTRMAAVIFAGRVIAIRRHQGVDGATGIVEIDFAVDDAIRGVCAGAYPLREWAGLWPAGYEPFAVGQQYLMLLHAPGAAGLSSPVGGSDGAIPIGGGDGARDGRVVDLRWIATRAPRTVSHRGEAVAHPMSLPVAVRADAADVGGLQLGVSEPRPSGAPVAEGAAYTTVLGVLRSWEQGDHVAR
jgi:hypothetical protein